MILVKIHRIECTNESHLFPEWSLKNIIIIKLGFPKVKGQIISEAIITLHAFINMLIAKEIKTLFIHHISLNEASITSIRHCSIFLLFYKDIFGKIKL